MLRIVKLAIVTNSILSLLFVLSNYVIWDSFNRWQVTFSRWNPIAIVYTPGEYQNGYHAIVSGQFMILNLPFWIFWVLMVANLYFVFKLQKSKAR